MNARVEAMQTFCRAVLRDLADTPPDRWAEEWVEARMEFCHLFPHDLLSTSHGIDFFANVIAGPDAWDEKGEYGNNFRKMFR